MGRRKPDVNDEERRLIKIAAAWLRSLGYKQKQIATHLGRGQSLVSSALKEAEQDGLQVLNPQFIPEAIDLTDEDFEKAKNLCIADEKLEQQLKRLQERPVEFRLAVFPSGIEPFANAAAQYVVELLAQSTCIGVMYGRTLERLVKAINVTARARRKQFAKHMCVPLSGSPNYLLNLQEEIYTSSRLAMDLQQALTGRVSNDLPSLTGVQAYIPRKYALNGHPTNPHADGTHCGQSQVAEFVYSMPGCRQIFGCNGHTETEPYITRTDTVLTALGIVAPKDANGAPYATGAFIRERIAAEQSNDVNAERLRELIYGDIGGCLLPRRDLEKNGRDAKLVKDLNCGWTGFRQEHLAQIAARARKDGPPGVIVTTLADQTSSALLAERTAMTKEVVRLGLVNHLICSRDIAECLRADLLGHGPADHK
jgi:transposase